MVPVEVLLVVVVLVVVLVVLVLVLVVLLAAPAGLQLAVRLRCFRLGRPGLALPFLLAAPAPWRALWLRLLRLLVRARPAPAARPGAFSPWKLNGVFVPPGAASPAHSPPELLWLD